MSNNRKVTKGRNYYFTTPTASKIYALDVESKKLVKRNGALIERKKQISYTQPSRKLFK